MASTDELATALDANRQAAEELTAQIGASEQLAEELVSSAQSLGAGGVVAALQSVEDRIEQARSAEAAKHA
ncbi:hypothetical protein [Glycomyces arizonensis]|uniref:hypothetical protein n=1 Tax=Glycomyces arizonensis TaxID=256035 RepID=UPI0004173ED6|nr:hypothetical protein [Glycomyces arizonensis]